MQTLIPDWTDYALLDTGAGKKLERFGEFTLVRHEPQAKWSAALPRQKWDAADGEFVKAGSGQHGEWKFRKPIPTRWQMRRKSLSFWVQPAPSGHVGVFPDQACHWDWIEQAVTRAARSVKALCLFGHTGLATLVAAAAGAEVTHVDASRKAVAWARENQSLSGLNKRPIRWIVEDALTFVWREARRGNRYDALMLDPPRFGRGPDGQLWKLHDSLPELLAACTKLLSASPAFVLLNVYTTVLTEARIKQDAEALRSHLQDMLRAERASAAPPARPHRATRSSVASTGGLTRTNLGSASFSAGLPPITTGQLVFEDAGRRKIPASMFARTEWAYTEHNDKL
jgi:23S rRNA (cytosine1962-C5)-methyltransferase